MKKILSIVLCLMLALSLCTVAFAETDLFVMEDFAPHTGYGPTWTSVGWKYMNDTVLPSITAIEVGLKNADDEIIVTYTADNETVGVDETYNPDGKNQIEFQASYYGTDLQRSAPFSQDALKSADVVAKSLVGADWTITAGPAFLTWGPASAYVKITTAAGTFENVNSNYTNKTDAAFNPATSPVAEGEDAYYLTMAAAVADGGEIKLLKDVTEDVTVPAGTEVVIDATGYTLDGTLTVEDGADLTIVGGTFTDLGAAGYLADGLTMNSNGDVVEKSTSGSSSSGTQASTSGSTTVESAKTFDAGIALYVGMALSSAAGAAYVTKKH